MTTYSCKDCNSAITGKGLFKPDGSHYCHACTPDRLKYDREVQAGREAQRKARKGTDRKRGRP